MAIVDVMIKVGRICKDVVSAVLLFKLDEIAWDIAEVYW